ncbi:hypothetical protein ACA910_022060 [Epithemia clementina (nom. ined.)]
MAADVHPYVDNMRETGLTEDDRWAAASRMAKTASYYGLQDAAQKRRPPSLTPGAGAGALVTASPTGVYKLVSGERWAKVKEHIGNLKEWAQQDTINRKALERVCGFLVYVSLTYSMITTYLKGIHLTLVSWRPDRDESGWKMTPREWAELNKGLEDCYDECSLGAHAGRAPPVDVSPRLLAERLLSMFLWRPDLRMTLPLWTG